MFGQALVLCGLHPLPILFFLQRSPPLFAQGSLFFGPELSPPLVEPFFVGLVRPLLFHFGHPVLLGLGVPAFDFTPLFLRHGIIAFHPILHFFGFKGLILSVGFQVCHVLVVTSTMEGLYFFNPVHGCIHTFPIQFLVPFVDLGVPFFSVRCWCIHTLILAIGKNTRPLTLATFERDSL